MNARTLCAFGLLSLRLMGKPTADSKAMIPLPGSGFNGDRYTTLWTKSPFAIATPEAGAGTQDYQLVGLARLDGVSYASLIDKQTQEHFVLASDKPVKNLTLVSISRGSNGATAVIERNGIMLSLKQDVPPAANGTPLGIAPPPSGMNLTLPQANPSVGGMPPIFPNRPYFHRPFVKVPPPPTTPPPPPPSQ